MNFSSLQRWYSQHRCSLSQWPHNKPNAGELLSEVFIESNFGHNLFGNWEYIC